MSQQSVLGRNGGQDLPPETKTALAELKSDFATLREDLTRLRKDVTSLSASGAAHLKGAVTSGLSEVENKAQDLAEHASSELHEIQGQAQRAIRKNPLSAMAAALAIGYFLSGIISRR